MSEQWSILCYIQSRNVSAVQAIRGAGSGGPGGHGPPDFTDIEKRTEAEIEIDNLGLLTVAP